MKMLQRGDPDIILLLETDNFWLKGVSKLEEQYPYSVLIPLENTYGMLLFSKFELIAPQK